MLLLNKLLLRLPLHRRQSMKLLLLRQLKPLQIN
jgi:hypothetical protein